ncbi:hypothetical protein M1L60_40060 [Actinoplanes sp. TRM 88003]|uniref:Uncharacterized protein n=1 Tax=Paractinoplanes aksuensis TaxID=2939490 RepID=A0ABT1E1T5_9ACTN|nr:DUF6640 family protein [Actinoplanes aksuensis]MCO8276793.1 hypothetical protein [Actinoplanes aksuensis]
MSLRRTGRIVLTVALAATLLGPTVVDFNESHVFNEDWPPHARYHAVMLLAIGMAMSVVGLWLVWRRSTDPVTSLRVAAAVPVVVWGAFFVPLFVPGTSVEEYPGEVGRLLGLPLNLLLAGVFIALTLAGYGLATRRP